MRIFSTLEYTITVDVTAILLNYQRPSEMSALIENLKNQSIPIRIILTDNAKTPHPAKDMVDRYVHVPWNGGCFMRLFLAHYVDTEYVLFMDDDRLPRDREYVRDALSISKEHPGVLTGAHGRLLSTTPPHHYHEDAWGLVHVIKGFMVLFERDLLPHVPVTTPFRDEKAVIERCDDIHLSLMTGRAERVHWADRRLHERLHDLDATGIGYSHDPRHGELRDRIAKRYLEFFGLL